MSVERKGLLKIGDQEVVIVGEDVRVGALASEFTAHSMDWKDFNGLADTRGKVRIIAALPSLHTSVCDRETRDSTKRLLDWDLMLSFSLSAWTYHI